VAEDDLKFMSSSSSQKMYTSSGPIAIFDSGIGGLSVLREVLKILPHENYVYYADTDHVPYGTKTKEEVKTFVLSAAEFLSSHRIKMLVVACNTATSIAIAELRSRYNFPVIGMEPAVKPAVSNPKNKRVLVLATQLTLKEQKFKELVDKVDNEKIVDLLPLPELVTLAEQFIFDEGNTIPVLSKTLSNVNINDYGTVVLGCTHYPFYKEVLKKIFPEGTEIIDGNSGTVNHMKNVLEKDHMKNMQTGNGEIVFYQSGRKISDVLILDRYRSLIR
jgi:glutamate racemase